MGATDDQLVQRYHVQNLHDAWGGSEGECCGLERRLLHFGGGHNGRRPPWFIAESVNFLRCHLEQAAVARRWYGRWRWLESPLQYGNRCRLVLHSAILLGCWQLVLVSFLSLSKR